MTLVQPTPPESAQPRQQPLRIAVAGLGVGSTQVLPAMETLPEVQLVAAADQRPQALEAFQRKYGGRTYESVEQLCQDPDVEAIWISTPNQFHYPHTLLAAEHGKHVVIEKPMALSLEEAERMVEATERNGVQLLCGHTQSFSPCFRAMRDVIRTGEIGRLQAINVVSYSDWMVRPRMPQEVDVHLGGGIPYRQGPHQVDTVRLLGGGLVRSVRAMTGQWLSERPCPGYYAAFLQFEDGTPSTIIHNGYGYFNTAELYWGFEDQDEAAMGQRMRARAALRRQEAQEEQAKESMRFGGDREGEMAHVRRPDDAPSRPNIPGTLALCW